MHATAFDHIEELRNRFLKVLLCFVLASAFFYRFVDHVLVYMIKPVGKLVFTAPAEAFMATVWLTLLGGFILSLPVTLYHVWAFTTQGLMPHERRFIKIFGPLSFVFFIAGAAFAYYVILPIAFRFLLSFSSEYVVPMITIQKYISFAGSMILAFGCVFEMPLILAFLAKIGIATPEFLRQKRRYAVVIILIVSAFLTPPDVITQLLMAGPVILLYELGIVFAGLSRKANHVA
jgi:sec-independent protein translocase protein TatC